MYVPVTPSETEWCTMEGQLKSTCRGCDIDFTTFMLYCTGLPPDDARRLISGLVTEACLKGQGLPQCHSDLEASETPLTGTSSIWGGYTDSSAGESLESLSERMFKDRFEVKINNHLAAARVADAAVESLCGCSELSSISTLEASIAFEDKASCGWPHFVSAAESPLEYVNEAQRLEHTKYALEYASSSPAVLQCRLTARGLGKHAKPRAIFGVCRRDNIAMKRLFIPMLKRLRQHYMFSALNGREAVDSAVTGLMRKMTSHRKMISLDYSKFDTTVPFEVIDRIFRIARNWFHVADHALIDYCCAVVKCTGLLIPGRLLPGRLRTKGIPSGCVLTNWLGSNVNIWVTHFAVSVLGGRIVKYVVQGDDGVLLVEGIDHHEQLSEVIQDTFGMILNPTKTSTSNQNVTFCQNTHNYDYCVKDIFPGVRSLIRAFGRMGSLSTKRSSEKWTPTMDALRNVQQLDDCSSHPRFTQACKLLLSWDEDAVIAVVKAITDNSEELTAAMNSVLWSRQSSFQGIPKLHRSPVVRELNRLLLG